MKQVTNTHNQQQHFSLRDTVRYIEGAKRSALYDLESGYVYSINEVGTNLLQPILSDGQINITHMNNEQSTFFIHMTKIGLGEIHSRPKVCGLKESTPIINPRLDFLWLEVSGRCNLKCIHCYADLDEDQSKDFSTAFWMDIIDQAVAMKCLKFQFIGGEPLMRKDLRDLINHACSRGAEFIEVFTNGVLLDQDIIRYFSENDVNIAVSLFGPNNMVHDSIVKVRDSFHRLDRNLRFLKKYDIKTRVAVIIMKQNEKYLGDIRDYLKGIGFEIDRPDIVRPSGRGCNCGIFPTTPDILAIGYITEANFSTSHNHFYWNKRFNSCWAGKAVVKNNGDVSPCIFARDIIVGNVDQMGLEGCIQSKCLQTLWRITKDSVERCKHCEYRYACRDCRALAISETGNIYSDFPRCLYNPLEGEWKKLCH